MTILQSIAARERELRGFAACLLLVVATWSLPSRADAQEASVSQGASLSQDAPTALEEVVVTGERAGPGLWHVYKGAAQLWIFGTVTPLPKDMTWKSKQLESILDSTNQVLVAKPVEFGVARAVWVMITQRSLLVNADGRKLRQILPPDLYARFAKQRAKFTDDESKWEKYRPVIAAALLQEDVLHRVGLSTHLDLGAEVRRLARKHNVRIDEFKVAGARDLLEALKTLPPETENKCMAASLSTIETGMPRLIDRAQAWATGDVARIQSLPESPEVAACRTAATTEAGSGDLYALLKSTWIDNMEKHLRTPGTTLAVVSMDMLLEPGGFLETLRARGYSVDTP